MIDIKLLRDKLDWVKEQLAKRYYVLDVDGWHVLEDKRKGLQVEVEALQNERNSRSKGIGQAKAQGEAVEALMADMKVFGDSLAQKSQDLDRLLEEQQHFVALLPNIPHASVPIGRDEAGNQWVSEWGQKPTHCSTWLDHVALTEKKGGIDFEGARQLSGARFGLLKGEIARLHRALGQWMLDVHTEEHGYQEHYVPYLVHPHCLFGTGQLPKFKDDLFQTHDARGLYLIPTAEVPLTNTVRETLLESDALPMYLTAHSPCFRSEAGSYGKDTRGMFRQHQFDKVELVQIVAPEKSYEALEILVLHAETILRQLKLAYRKVLLCTGDMGATAAKTYDLEVWLPGQGQYREISSCSNCEDYQARRMMARVRSDHKNEYVHTLNGSGVAVGRCLIAVLENYQQPDGSINIPEVLIPYMKGKSVIMLNL